MKLQKITAVALVLFTLVSLIACGTEPAVTETTTAAPSAETTVAAETTPAVDDWGREIVSDDIPDTLKFEGETLKIFSRSDASNRWSIDFYAADQTGVKLNDAVYKRNAEVMERLGIDIQLTEKPGSYNEFDSYASYITKAYQSGAHEYDLCGTYSLYGASYATKGYFQNVNNFSNYLNLDKVWWNQSLRGDLTISDKLYFLVGDMNITTLTRMLVLFFNKQLVTSNLQNMNLYEEVIDGKWTIERLTEILANTYIDNNGNSVADPADTYGLVTVSPSEAYDGLAASLDVHILVRNEEGNWTVTENPEHLYTAAERTAKLYFSGNNSTSFMSIANCLDQFAGDRSIFMLITLDKATEEPLSNMTSDYGILPLPKYDEDQAAYYTIPQDAFNLISILGNVENPDMVAAAVELMCAGSYRSVTPDYFEEVLKYRYMRDSESGQMLDFLRSGLRFDFATINTLNLSDAGRWFRSTMDGAKGAAGSGSAAQFKAQKKVYEKALATFQEAYDALEP